MTIEQLSIATIRALSIDMTNRAKSGHPGMPIGSAPLLYTLFTKHLITNPDQPNWINRDRFVLSAGHASALLYSLLHLSGFALPIDQLKSFRQLNSITPGHPEYGLTPGVDATTGPLGQGVGQAVGMALAERTLKSIYAPLGLIDHFTYVLLGDGCLQEGVTQEVISFAGHQKLNKLIMIYDANDVTLDGPLHTSFSEDVKKRFLSANWNVLNVENGNDIIAIDKAIKKAKKSNDKPTLIIMKTIIGFGSINQGTSKVHGSPLGEEDGKKTKLSYGYDYPEFFVSEEVYDHFRKTIYKRGRSRYRKWQSHYKQNKAINEQLTNQFTDGININVQPYLQQLVFDLPKDYRDATRNTSHQLLQKMHQHIPFFIGGSADVSKSVMTTIKEGSDCLPNSPEGRTIHFGIREFGAASIQNGLLLHQGLITYIGTFLVFADYMKPAIRLGALSHLPSIYLFSHDSIALGEDGPTHQPIEQLAMLRSIPNMTVFRPCDGKETLGAYHYALTNKKGPTALILSRQALPLLTNSDENKVNKGGYVIDGEEQSSPDLTIIATGSEVSLALKTKEILINQGYKVRVVSMISKELFLKQTESYQNQVLATPYEKRVTIEALSSFGWHQLAKHTISVDTFGKSAPGSQVLADYGFELSVISEKLLKIILSNK
jgi:transketolase